MNTELYIGPNKADINNDVAMEFSLGDIRDLSEGSMQSSYDIELPLTKTNKELIKHGHELNVLDEITAEAKILYKSAEVFRGKIKQVKVRSDIATLIINGNNWADRYEERRMSDLDLSAYDEVYNSTNIQASWTASDPFIRYPLCSWGKGAMHAVYKYSNDFVPWFNIYKILVAILKDYTIVSTFLTGTYFKSLYMLAKELCQESGFLSDKDLEVTPTSGSDNFYQLSYNVGEEKVLTQTFNPIVLNNEIADEGEDFISNTYTIPETGTYRIKFSADPRMSYTGLTATSPSFTLEIRLNGTAIESYSASVDPGVLTYVLDTEYRHFTAGDLITCYCRMYVSLKNNSGVVTTASLFMAATTKLENVMDGYCLNAGLTMTIEPEKWLPDISQADFIQAVKQLFNLQFFFDKWNNTLYIEPLETWHTTEKISLTAINESSIESERISPNYSKTLVFGFKDDTSDKYLQSYQNAHSELGLKEVDLTSVYAKEGEQEFRNNLFSTFYKATKAFIWGDWDHDNFDRPQSRATSFGTKIAAWHGYTTASDWYFETTLKHYVPEIDQLDFATLYASYYAKTVHLIDLSKIVTVEIKPSLAFLQQFITIVNSSDEEGFRPEYELSIGGVDYAFWLNKISFNGPKAVLELILKT